MSKLIIPEGSEIAALTEKAESGDLSRQERKKLDRMMREMQDAGTRQVRVKDLPPLVANIVDPALSAVYRNAHFNNLLLNAMRQALLDAGILTEEQMDEAVKKIAKRIEEEQATPNSPALEESKEASEGREVSRLIEVPTDEENAPRRLVD